VILVTPRAPAVPTVTALTDTLDLTVSGTVASAAGTRDRPYIGLTARTWTVPLTVAGVHVGAPAGPLDNILTEAGDTLTTEAGDQLTTET
jgi:hypothetical protein